METEYLNAYDAKGGIIKTEGRIRLLGEMKAHSLLHGDSPFAVDCVNLMLSNSQGQVFLVKRGDKPENPFLFDKTVGGHVTAGESHYAAIFRETQEEIGATPLITDMLSFHKVLQNTDTQKYAVIRPIDFQPWFASLRAQKDGHSWYKRHRVMLFSGVYDGPIQFVDGEAVGFQLVPKAEVLEMVKETPDVFTNDLEILFKRYSAFF